MKKRYKYNIKKCTPEIVEKIFNIEIKKSREKYIKTTLEKFVEFATYSEKLKTDNPNDSEDRGTNMGERNYYTTKASNKTWSKASNFLQELLKQEIINDPDFDEQCNNFIKNANEKVVESPKMTTLDQLEDIKKTINFVIKNLIQYGGENIIEECKTILNTLGKQEDGLKEALKSLPENTADEKIKEQIVINEEIENIGKTKDFIKEQVKIKTEDKEN